MPIAQIPYNSASTLRETPVDPPDDWGGRAGAQWALPLAENPRFDSHAGPIAFGCSIRSKPVIVCPSQIWVNHRNDDRIGDAHAVCVHDWRYMRKRSFDARVGFMLTGYCILIVEDEYFLADDVAAELTTRGAKILGPVASVADAHELISGDATIDAAILDVNLRGEWIFPVAEQLQDRGIPVLFATGYDASVMPDRFADVARLEKPINVRIVAEHIGELLQSHKPAARPRAQSRT